MKARKLTVAAAAVLLAGGGAAIGQTHAPWPTGWNNWSDPVLWATVGNPGNVPDMRYNVNQRPEGYGAVNYAYRIGRFEVTAGQYCSFLNAVGATDTYGLYNTDMWYRDYGCMIRRSGVSGSYTYSVASDFANRPVTGVSWGNAARFANWVTNGQPTGT